MIFGRIFHTQMLKKNGLRWPSGGPQHAFGACCGGRNTARGVCCAATDADALINALVHMNSEVPVAGVINKKISYPGTKRLVQCERPKIIKSRKFKPLLGDVSRVLRGSVDSLTKGGFLFSQGIWASLSPKYIFKKR